ncbi:MAG: hypothetical protein M3478_16185 [Planctomycetota bacterium]|nr:hypothetical protein [Planctomycetota bacterium]
MLSPLRPVARLLVLVCVLASGSGPSQPPASRAADPLDSETARIEVRALRKLHLVRPDLIPYPIAYEVCC